MKKLLLFSLLYAALLTGCFRDPESAATGPAVAPPLPTAAATTALTTAPSEAPVSTTATPPESTAAPTEPIHSGLYIPGVEVEDVTTWFNEVCMAAEFVNSGDPSFLQKWDQTICYRIHGDTTEDDLAVLESFTQWLNTLEGFPGIREATDPQEVNLNIHFCSQEEMRSRMGGWTDGLDGAITFWYDDSDRIYDAIICIRRDLNQHLRSSVILEELYNGLGPVQDTSLRPDSLIYAGFSEPQGLTEIDRLILQLLYHPRLQCGMNTAQCEAVIRELYY